MTSFTLNDDVFIDAAQLLKSISEKAAGCADQICVTQYGVVETPKKTFPLIRLESSFSSEKWMILFAGIHGNEIGGPLAFRRHLLPFFAAAKERNIHLVMYPCVNPSGFDARTRYNFWNQRFNNDFMRYEKGGALIGDLGCESGNFPWKWNQDLGIIVPDETMQLRKDIRNLPFSRVKAALDSHQDCFQNGRYTYAYVFGDKRRYAHIAKQAEQYAHLLKHEPIDEGQAEGISHPKTDEHGLVTRHDCSLEDVLHRMGVPHVVALETTSDVPLADVYAISSVWVYALMDKIFQEK